MWLRLWCVCVWGILPPPPLGIRQYRKNDLCYQKSKKALMEALPLNVLKTSTERRISRTVSIVVSSIRARCFLLFLSVMTHAFEEI